MSRMNDYITALKNGRGYDWIANHGWELRKDELIDIIKEFDYAIHTMRSYDDKDDVYNAVCEELTDSYNDEEE